MRTVSDCEKCCGNKSCSVSGGGLHFGPGQTSLSRRWGRQPSPESFIFPASQHSFNDYNSGSFPLASLRNASGFPTTNDLLKIQFSLLMTNCRFKSDQWTELCVPYLFIYFCNLLSSICYCFSKIQSIHLNTCQSNDVVHRRRFLSVCKPLVYLDG